MIISKGEEQQHLKGRSKDDLVIDTDPRVAESNITTFTQESKSTICQQQQHHQSSFFE